MIVSWAFSVAAHNIYYWCCNAREFFLVQQKKSDDVSIFSCSRYKTVGLFLSSDVFISVAPLIVYIIRMASLAKKCATLYIFPQIVEDKNLFINLLYCLRNAQTMHLKVVYYQVDSICWMIVYVGDNQQADILKCGVTNHSMELPERIFSKSRI